jgi:hypothetical protein
MITLRDHDILLDPMYNIDEKENEFNLQYETLRNLDFNSMDSKVLYTHLEKIDEKINDMLSTNKKTCTLWCKEKKNFKF